MADVCTVFADIDGNGIKAFSYLGSAEMLLAQLENEKDLSYPFIEVHGGDGSGYLAVNSITYFASGRRRIPVSASPSSNSQGERSSLVTPSLG